MYKTINIQGSITSDKDGYSRLSQLYYDITSSHEKNVILDCISLKWFDANLAAVLGTIIKLAECNGYTIQFQNIPFKTSNIFLRNGFLNRPNTYMRSNSGDTIINYWEFLSSQEEHFHRYIEDEILDKDCFPVCSDALRKKVVSNIFELYVNASMHGKTNYIFTCGQHYPNNTPARLDFTIVNIGRTFKDNVNDFMSRDMTAHECIDWATKMNNSTKPNDSGGLGLSLLIEFIKLNKGKIQIVSDRGFWEYNNGVNTRNTEISNSFPGVIVNIEFNVSNINNVIYKLKEEIVPTITNLF